MKSENIGLRKTEFIGYDLKAMEKFYNSQVKQAKRVWKSDQEAHDMAMYFVDYYKHQFRAYS